MRRISRTLDTDNNGIGGGTHQINSWSLAINTIPEPGTSVVALLALAALPHRLRRC